VAGPILSGVKNGAARIRSDSVPPLLTGQDYRCQNYCDERHPCLLPRRGAQGPRPSFSRQPPNPFSSSSFPTPDGDALASSAAYGTLEILTGFAKPHMICLDRTNDNIVNKKKLIGIGIACAIAIAVVIILVIPPLLNRPKPKLTLADAPNVLDLSAELPTGFSGSYNSTPLESPLLGTGSGSQYHIRGEIAVTPPWYEIQLVLWVVDNKVAQNTSVEDVLAAYQGTGNRIDVGSKADAIKEGDYGSGVELIVIKYENAYVLMISWYSHPQDGYVDMIPLAKAVAKRLSRYSY
jgi:hypothetical protein